MPGLLLLLFPFLVESPRWLLCKDRASEATAALAKLRKANIPSESIISEINMFDNSQANHAKGTWKEVLNSNNKVSRTTTRRISASKPLTQPQRRTLIAILAMVGQQITGQAFATQYSVVFYKQQGFTNSFALGSIMQALGVVAVLITATIVDSFGRRRLLIGGALTQAVFLFILGSVATVSSPNEAEKNLMVASIMLFFFFYLLAWAPLPYVVLGEASSRRVVEKTSNLAVSLSVATAFLVSFTVPYLIGADYGNIGGRVGFIYGSLSVAVAGLTFFFIPEMKGRSLETLDELFTMKTATRKFGHAVPSGAVISSRVRTEKQDTTNGGSS